MKEDIPYFGSWLKQRRKALGLTRSNLANLVPCSPSTIHKIETGVRRPSREMAIRLIENLHVSKGKRLALVEISRASALSGSKVTWADHFHPQSNLTIPPTPLIGRDHEVSIISQMILREPGSLITIVGPPGVGKTRIAIKVANDLRDQFEDGVFMVPLASIGDSELVLPFIARIFNLENCYRRSIIDQIIDYLRDQEILLLVDNFEHLLNATGSLIRIRSECPRISILITSRISLRVRGERQFHVQPLKLPDLTHLLGIQELLEYSAIAFFVDRARAVQPGFNLDENNTATVVDICQRLDGLPLAIELSAANLRILTPHMLLENLKKGGLPRSGELLDLEPRQRTLRDTLDWSYRLLSPGEQKLLERLAVFSGGCSLEAAQMVCDIEQKNYQTNDEDRSSQILDQLGSLVNKCLIIQQEENNLSRFTMLEVLREYLWEKFIASEESDEVQKQHAGYFLQLAEGTESQTHGVNTIQTLTRLEKEINNFRAALEWCLSAPQALDTGLRLAGALWPFWTRGGHITEGKTWLLRTLGRSEGENLAESNVLFPLAKVYTGLSRIIWSQGDYMTACSYAEKSISLLRQVGDKWYLSYSLQNLADILSDLGDYSRALDISSESLKFARETGDPWLEGMPFALLGELARNRGDYHQAQGHYAACLALMKQAGDERNSAFMLHNLGQVAQLQGDYTQAKELHIEGLRILSNNRAMRGVALGLEKLAGVAGVQGTPIKAARLLGAAEALRQSAGCPVEGTERLIYSRIVSQAQAGLDHQSFNAAWVEGFTMTLDEAIAYALEE